MNLVFISSKSWETYFNEGFRTRQGALLRSFANSHKIEKILLVVSTGFGGRTGFKSIPQSFFPSDIFEINIPNIFPESLTRLIEPFQLSSNHQINNGDLSKIIEIKIDLIWSYSASLGSLFKKISNKPLMYDIIDYRTNDPNLTTWQKFLWRKEIMMGCRSSDRVICNGESAFNSLFPYTNKIVLLRNGVDIDRFSKLSHQNERNGVGFVGIISNWIDFELLEYILKQSPNLNIKFHGIVRSEDSRLSRLQNYPNFHWQGPINPDQVPEFLSNCRVTIVPYDSHMIYNTTGDSMKIFESLAAGTPVVTTNFQSNLSKKFQDLISIGDNNASFLNLVSLFDSSNPEPQWQKRAWDFCVENSWQHRVNEILSLASSSLS